MKKAGKYIATFLFGLSYSIYYSSLFFFGYEMNTVIVASMLENETEMVWYYVNFKIVLLSLIFIGTIFFIFKKITFNTEHKKHIFFTCLIIVAVSQILGEEKRKYIFSNPTIHFVDLINPNKINRAKEGLKYSKKYEKHLENLFSFNNDDNIDIVFIVGESARWDFFEKYTPLIKREGVISLKSLTNAEYTREVLPEILSFKKDNKNYSIVDIFNSLDFDTHWIGAQNIRGRNDSSYAYFAMNSDVKVYKEPKRTVENDFVLLDYLDNFIAKNGKNFFIIHQIGSHTPFYKRSSEKTLSYKSPDCKKTIKECNMKDMEMAYINSILYTDMFLQQVITRFKNKKNVLIFYRSDHGTHFVSLDKQENSLVVPSFFLLNGYLKANQNNLLKNSKKNIIFTNDRVVESILDCAGIESELIDKKHSMCSKYYK